MTAVDDFILDQPDPQKEILQYLHLLLTEELGLIPKIRYKIPFYYYKSWICYLNPLKEGGIELAFTRGNELSNEQGLLNFKGRKQVCGLDIRSVNAIPHEALYEILQEALILDENKPYASKRSK